MARLKLYTITCKFYTNGKIVSIDLVKLLDRYDIKPQIRSWGVDYDLEKMIRSHVYSSMKVRYENSYTYVKTYEGYEIPPFHFKNEEQLGNLADWMNFMQTKIITDMSEEEFRKRFSSYGNNYTEQVKGERYL
jgi:hypothetical protein